MNKVKQRGKPTTKPQEQQSFIDKDSTSGTSTPDHSLNSKVADIRTLRRHTFTARVSLLDDMDANSELSKNSLVGFYNMLYVIAFFYFIVHPLLQYKSEGKLMDSKLYKDIKRDFLLCLITWPIFYAWCHIALLIQYLALYDVSKYLIFTIQHASQLFMFLYAHYLVLTRNWCMSHGAFVTFQSCIFFMKMHSYTMTNYKMRREWKQDGCPIHSDPYAYPNNINIRNFTSFIMTPVIVYEPVYPRTNTIRWKYVAVKVINTTAMLILAYMIAVQYVMPVIENHKNMSLFDSIFSITLPMICLCLTTFNMIFENYCNFWGEITQFSDRLFYTDWWNATDFEEFNRKWNRPVYEFLYRHVYLELIFECHLGVRQAQLFTFLFSALLHEYTLCVSMQQITPVMILFMMIQIPVMILTKHIKGTRFGNVFFWWGIIQGVPLILNLYLRFNELPGILIL